jgi:hypothetical protein
VNSTQCAINADSLKTKNIKCIWVENEPSTKCQEIKEKCEDVGTSPTCEEDGAVVIVDENNNNNNEKNVTCVWLEASSSGVEPAEDAKCVEEVYYI